MKTNTTTLLTTILIVFLCITHNISAQQSTVSGTIQDKNNEPISGASIALSGTSKTTHSDALGNFQLTEISEGQYVITVHSNGFLPLTSAVEIQENKTYTFQYNMYRSTTDLPEVSILTGGKNGIQEIPGSVYFLSPKEVQRFNYTDINRSLKAVPGVSIQEEDGFGLRPNIGLRGTGVERSSKITIMEDGVLMSPAPYAAPAAYYFPTFGRMQATEILKGSSQIKYGPYTTGGAINLISTEIPNHLSGKVNLIGGSFGSKNVHANIGNRQEQFAYMLETFRYSADGFKVLDNGGNTGFTKKDYLGKIRYNSKATAKHYQSLTFKVGRSSEASNETYLGLTAEDFQEDPNRRYAASQKDNMATEQSQFSMTHFLKISQSSKLTTTIYRTDFKRNWYKLDKVIDDAGDKNSISTILDNSMDFNSAFSIITGGNSGNDNALQVKANNRKYYAKGIQSNLQIDIDGEKNKQKIDIGIRLHQDRIDRFQWVDGYSMIDGTMTLNDSGRPGTESNRIETADAFASYIQYKLKFNKFLITPGLRYENIMLKREDFGKADPDRTGADLSERENSTEVVIPGIGLNYDITEFFSSFAGIHKGFAPAGSKEGALPEESINYELGLRINKGDFSTDLVFFVNDYDNLLGSDLSASGGGGTAEMFNGGEVLTQGVEFLISGDLVKSSNTKKINLPVSLSYTYTDATFLNDFESDFEGWGAVHSGDNFPYLAHNRMNFQIGLQGKTAGLNISASYQDEMRTAPGQGEIPDNEKTDAFSILDLSGNYLIYENVTLFCSVKNLLNETYVVARRPAGLRPGLPRAINIGVKANF